jgi:hypothetical protein
MSYYLVETKGEDDRPEETAGWIAKHLAVTLHGVVAARPTYPGQWQGESQRPGDEGPSWHRYNQKGNPVGPEEGQVVV